MNTIYALLDPDTKHPRYVGQTSGSPMGRMRAIAFNAPNRDVSEWIGSLSGRQPLVEILEENVHASEAENRECYWIKKFKRRGHKLLNKEFNGEIHVATRSKSVTVVISADKFKVLKTFADRHSMTISVLMRKIVNDFIDGNLSTEGK